jgi:hypothetical protein
MEGSVPSDEELTIGFRSAAGQEVASDRAGMGKAFSGREPVLCSEGTM